MNTIISVAEAKKKVGAHFIDVQFDLANLAWGESQFEKEHIAGAQHVNLETELSSPKGDGALGRHPLVDPKKFGALLGTLGISPQTPVICYDQGSGMWAARMWWLLHWVGHANAWVLDGGLAGWKHAEERVEAGKNQRHGGPAYPVNPGQMPSLKTEAVVEELAKGRPIVDARAPERFRGEVEPIDPKAGHIPGATNIPIASMLNEGKWMAVEKIAAKLEIIPDDAIVYCGSGVTACHLVLSAAHAGRGPLTLYEGSWSAWSHASGNRPVETG